MKANEIAVVTEKTNKVINNEHRDAKAVRLPESARLFATRGVGHLQGEAACGHDMSTEAAALWVRSVRVAADSLAASTIAKVYTDPEQAKAAEEIAAKAKAKAAKAVEAAAKAAEAAILAQEAEQAAHKEAEAAAKRAAAFRAEAEQKGAEAKNGLCTIAEAAEAAKVADKYNNLHRAAKKAEEQAKGRKQAAKAAAKDKAEAAKVAATKVEQVRISAALQVAKAEALTEKNAAESKAFRSWILAQVLRYGQSIDGTLFEWVAMDAEAEALCLPANSKSGARLKDGAQAAAKAEAFPVWDSSKVWDVAEVTELQDSGKRKVLRLFRRDAESGAIYMVTAKKDEDGEFMPVIRKAVRREYFPALYCTDIMRFALAKDAEAEAKGKKAEALTEAAEAVQAAMRNGNIAKAEKCEERQALASEAEALQCCEAANESQAGRRAKAKAEQAAK